MVTRITSATSVTLHFPVIVLPLDRYWHRDHSQRVPSSYWCTVIVRSSVDNSPPQFPALIILVHCHCVQSCWQQPSTVPCPQLRQYSTVQYRTVHFTLLYDTSAHHHVTYADFFKVFPSLKVFLCRLCMHFWHISAICYMLYAPSVASPWL